ncbi:thiopurine S-methyltransferase-like [Haemaphysalis longicornis]
MYGAPKKDGQEFWLNQWKEGLSAAWQEEGVTQILLDNKDVVLAGKKQARVFVPLCGKAHELKWFLDLGHSVVGVEYVEDCVREYFSENNLSMEETSCPAINCKILQTTDNRLRVFVCSIFNFRRECAGLFDIVWDRSGFTAIKEDDREKYASVLKSLLAPGFSYGMWTPVYDAPWYKVSPRSTDEGALRKHFGDVAQVALVDTSVEQHAEYLDGDGPVTYCLWHLVESPSDPS